MTQDGMNTLLREAEGHTLIATGASPSSATKEYIYSGGALLATVTSSSTTYHHQDHLSIRMSTDANGNDLADQGHFPYGETWYMGSSGTKWQFTTYERDAESGNDYAQARSNVNRLARFSSLDPLSGDISDPQSLNRYSYVRNMPVMAVDPTGMWPCGSPVASKLPEGSEDKGAGHFLPDPNSEMELEPQGPGSKTACLDGTDPPTDGLVAGQGFAAYAPTGGLAATLPVLIGYYLETTSPASYFQPVGPSILPDGTVIPFMNPILIGTTTDIELYATYTISSASGSGSWWGTFTTTFFSPAALAKTTYHSFADQRGCDRLMIGTIAADLSPVPTDAPGLSDLTQNANAAVYAAGMARAAAYSASQGLIQPMKSSIYRSLVGEAIASSEAVGALAPQALVVGSAAHGLLNAGMAAYNGTCH